MERAEAAVEEEMARRRRPPGQHLLGVQGPDPRREAQARHGVRQVCASLGRQRQPYVSDLLQFKLVWAMLIPSRKAQWMQWLRHTRPEPPSINEQQLDEIR